MVRTHGSAAAELASTPESAVVESITRCASRLAHAARLATIEVAGPDPLDAAAYIVDTVRDLEADLRVLRRSVSNHQKY